MEYFTLIAHAPDRFGGDVATNPQLAIRIAR